MLPESWISELRARLDIVQVVSRRVQLTRKGGRYWGLCPFHGEKTPSFTVNEQEQFYYCFGCHASGTAINFVMETENLGFIEACRELAQSVNMAVPEDDGRRSGGVSAGVRERLLSANRECARFFHAQLWQKENRQVLEYFYRRGLTDSTIRRFGLGASPADRGLTLRTLREQGFTEEELVLSGIAGRGERGVYEFFRGRAMFPIIDGRGQVLGFGGRALDKDPRKYINTGDTPVFNKRRGVYAANLLRKEKGLRRIILTEGYMDVISLRQAGVTGVCATLGTALTSEQAQLIRRMVPEVWVSYDGDSAGQHAILRALQIFEQEQLPARVLDFPEGMDPDEFIRARGLEGFEALVPVDAAVYRMRREMEQHDMTTQEGRTAYAMACAKFLSKVTEPVLLDNYVRQLMLDTGFDREVLLAQIGHTELLGSSRQAALPRRRPLSTEEVFPGVDGEITRAELQLLSALATHNPDAGAVTGNDLISEFGKKTADALLAGTPVSRVLEEAGSLERGLLARQIQHDSELPEKPGLRDLGRCLSVLHARRLETRIRDLRERISREPPAGQMEILQEIEQLMKQLKDAGKE